MSYTFVEVVKNRKVVFSLLLILVLIPTYFIHTRSYPDWGDDFAQYVYQAQQINTPSKVYKEVLNIEEYSSSKRSVFFSVTMSAITPTPAIEKYIDFISVTYILAAVSFFVFLCSYHPIPISFLTTLSVFYNFLFLRLKSEVVPEFLFISLVLLALYLSFQSQKYVNYIIPVLIGLLISVRFIGLAFLFGNLFCLVFEKDITVNDRLKKIFTCLILVILTVFSINIFFLNGVQNREVTLYGTYVLSNINLNTILNNLITYSKYISLFFEQEIPFWINKLIISSVCSLFLVGFLIAFFKKINVIEFFSIFYFVFLIVYPYNADTIKYLIPIIPLFFYYTLFGITSTFSFFKIKWSNTIISGCLLVVLMSNSKTIWLAIKNQNYSVGPFDELVLNDFKQIQKVVKEDESIAFAKPFIISLLADRHSYFLSPNNYISVFQKTDFVLLSKQNISEIYPKTIGINLSKGDTTELTNFYLIKL